MPVGTCHLSLPRLTHVLLQLLIVKTREEFRVESRSESACAGRRGLAGQVFMDQVFSGAQVARPNTCIFSNLEEATVPHDQQKASPDCPETFWKNMCLVAASTSPKSQIYCHSPLLLWNSFSELFEVLSLGCSPHFAANKTSNSHVGYFLSQHYL